jgi:adenine phosphoribosyltransferase
VTVNAGDLLHRWVRSVPDWPEPGVTFRDLTPLFANADAFGDLIGQLAAAGATLGPVDFVVGIEARGFILGAPVADRLRAGFVPLRKAGKLPGAVLTASYDLEYGQATLEMHADAVPSGSRVLVLDDVLATGGTLAAAEALMVEAGATQIGSLVAIELTALAGRSRLGDVPLIALTEF